MQITKSRNHDHFWCENNVVFETYRTIRGLRYMMMVELDFNYPDCDKLNESMITFLNNILKQKENEKN